MNYNSLSSLMLLGGASLLMVGMVLRFAPGVISWVGRLPGDLSFKAGSVHFYLPLTTLLVINLIIYLMSALFNR